MRSAFLSILTVLFASLAALGQSEYVITNNNELSGNTATVFQLDTASGSLRQAAVLQTGGDGTGNFLDVGEIEEAITSNGSCIFVVDGDSNDIAAFSKASGYTRVGNYFSGSVAFGSAGGSITLSPDNQFLYGSYGESGNIGAWQINGDCSLTFIDAYAPSGGSANFGIKVTPNGGYLVVPIPTHYSAELFSIGQTGALVDIGSLYLCDLRACSPMGVDITADSRLAVFAGSVGGAPAAFTAEITPAGLTNLKAFSLVNSVGLMGDMIPFLSSAAYAGSGNLYFGFTLPAGAMTTSFAEEPTSIVPLNATPIGQLHQYDGSIAATGNVMVVAEFPNVVGVFSINPDGSLTSLSSTTVEGAQGLVSVSVFPNTR